MALIRARYLVRSGPHPYDFILTLINPNTITLGVKTSAYSFWRDTNIQSITAIILGLVLYPSIRFSNFSDPLPFILNVFPTLTGLAQ